MNTHIRTTAIVVVGIATGTAIILAGTPTVATTSVDARTSGQETETMVLAFPWVGGHQRFIDNGRKGIGPGDFFLGVGILEAFPIIALVLGFYLFFVVANVPTLVATLLKNVH